MSRKVHQGLSVFDAPLSGRHVRRYANGTRNAGMQRNRKPGEAGVFVAKPSAERPVTKRSRWW